MKVLSRVLLIIVFGMLLALLVLTQADGLR